ncbi:histidine kinase [Carboxylicivirga sp. N1Y90]|uniref:sensor histidine kinase n=1 Tax=Carboxylicivirga fragile TaxID=3417571 RepID=UPI003D357FC9|nr:histidine kinase [Marinilabiliaceae bacterium N1Y90]
MRNTLCFILFLLSFQISHGQERPYRLYDTHTGLPQIQVTCIFQDVHGYIWTGTKAGLAQFNGEHWHQYLSNEHIYSIDNDKKGNLYVKASSGLYKYNGKSFRLIKAFQSTVKVLISDECYFIYSKEWVEQYEQDSLVNVYKVGIDFPIGGIETLAYEPKSKVLYCTDFISNDIYRIHKQNITKVFSNADAERVYVSSLSHDCPIINVVYTGNHIQVLSLPEGESIMEYQIVGDHIENLQVHNMPLKHYVFSHLYDYYLIDGLNNEAKKMQLDFVKGPHPVLIDRDAQMWVGSDNGLYQVWKHPFSVYPRSFMNDFWTIIEADDGQIYGGAFKQGLYRLDFETEQKEEIIAPGPFGTKETDYYYGASKDESGNIYFPTHYGLVKFNGGEAEKVTDNICLISKYDSITNQIVFGQQYGVGFIDEGGQPYYIIDETRNKVKSHPASIVFSGDSAIWLGTGKSLALYDRQKQTFVKASSLYSKAPKSGIIAMAKDEANNIWMGGRKGLWLFNDEGKNFEKIGLNYSGYITALIAPNDSVLLIGTTRELLVLNAAHYLKEQELRLKTYNFRNGLLAQEICQNGFLKRNNKVIFPSTTNTTEIDLEAIRFESESFDVAITHINNEPVAYSERNYAGCFNLHEDKNDLEFVFETIGFGLPTKPLYRFRLVGLSEKWSDWREQDYAMFSNLSSGRYRFEVAVKPSLVNGVDEQKLAVVCIKVDLPFYKEPHFYKYAFFILLLFFVVIVYIFWSRNKYKSRSIEQERKKRYLEVASLQANLNPHFIFNLLASVQNLITQHKPEVANQYLIKFSRLIRAYMEATIKSSKVVETKQANEISLKEEIDLLKMYIEFEQVKYRSKEFEYSIRLEDDDLLNKTIPPMIIQPFVENAIKHGIHPADSPCHLLLKFDQKGEGLLCTIVDNGIGREKSGELKSNSIKAHESRGLELINKRVDILNELGYHIDISIEDPKEGGTKVKILFNY